MQSSRRTFLRTMAASATVAVAAEATAPARSSPSAPPMDATRPRIHATSGGAPKLRLAYSWWSLIGLPRGGPEWTMEEKFRRVKEAGFEGIEMWVEPKDETQVRRLL